MERERTVSKSRVIAYQTSRYLLLFLTYETQKSPPARKAHRDGCAFVHPPQEGQMAAGCGHDTTLRAASSRRSRIHCRGVRPRCFWNASCSGRSRLELIRPQEARQREVATTERQDPGLREGLPNQAQVVAARHGSQGLLEPVSLHADREGGPQARSCSERNSKSLTLMAGLTLALSARIGSSQPSVSILSTSIAAIPRESSVLDACRISIMSQASVFSALASTDADIGSQRLRYNCCRPSSKPVGQKAPQPLA